MRSPLAGALLVAGALAALPVQAEAIPVFAHRYGFTCQVCHTEVPHLTAFGEQFLANGYRIAGLRAKPAFPAAVRIETAYASGGAADPDEAGGPLPKTIVDEVEVLLGGSLGPRASYWAEFYALDGGFPGSARDIWYAYRMTRDGAQTPLTLRAGQFTLPLPLDPETFRETTQPYAIWSQTAGANHFDFFAPKDGVQAAFGDPARAIAGTLSVLQGHDTQSGLPTVGADTMATLERDDGDVRVSAYRYDGERSLAQFGFGGALFISGVPDRFWRNGYSVGYARGANEVTAVYQNGNDSAADVYRDALQTSGAFLQARHDFGGGTFAIARWDATQDASFGRTVTAGVGKRLTRNTRLTLFATGERDFTGRYVRVLSSSLLAAW